MKDLRQERDMFAAQVREGQLKAWEESRQDRLDAGEKMHAVSFDLHSYAYIAC